MSQDTRKDKRAKIVSLNVRYKSATVDEFIENHSHDVSKGGLFIKTPTPFPPGTLLKFEIRIAGDKAVIAGVGRVVWKREPTQSVTERPAGMGVKFIKIDENSRAVIDKLIGVKSDAGSAYESGGESGSIVPIAPGSNPSELPAGASGAPPRPGAMASSPPVPRKATMLGIGSTPAPATSSSVPAISLTSATPPPVTPSTPVPAAAGKGMFPATNSEADMPKERTVMKQAAELLEEALKEAGGSMDDIGQNPLFTEEPKAGSKPAAADSKPADAAPKSSVPESPSTLIGLQASSDPDSESQQKPAKSTEEVASARTASEGKVPETTRESPNAKSSPTPPTVTKPIKTVPPKRSEPPAPARAVAAPEKKSNTMMWLMVAVVVGGGAVYAYQTGMIGGGDGPGPQATTSPSVAPPPTVRTPATVTMPTNVPPVASTAVIPAASSTAAVSDAATTAADAGKTAPAASTAPTATATATLTATARPTATATAAPRPTVTATATATTPPTTPTATEAPVPKPPKPPKPPPKPVDDNPY